MPKYDDIKKTLADISENVSAIDILLQFEDVLEKSGLYVYENWKLGEVVAGPNIEKHWVEVELMYPYKKMPEPVGALRLTKIGAKVFFGKDIYKEPRRITGPVDYEDPVTKEAKITDHKVWVIKIRIPRRIINQEIEEYLELEDINFEVDTDEVDTEYANDAVEEDANDGTFDEMPDDFDEVDELGGEEF